jgi:O-ureido-D-serine cyclo-ligase
MQQAQFPVAEIGGCAALIHPTCQPIAIVTAQAARPLDEDLPPLTAALERAEIAHEVVCWDDPGIDWARFGIVLLRSPWDYVPRLPAFLAFAEQAARLSQLQNPLAVIRWNTDKHYLQDLQRAGVATVPSVFAEPGASAAAALVQFFVGDFDEFVIKPSVGAGSKDAARYHRDDVDRAESHLQRLLDQGRSVLMQPYLGRVDHYGETSLIYFNGVFSHAIRKGPLLARAVDPTGDLFAPEAITARQPTAAERQIADQVIAALAADRRFQALTPLLYVRIDLLSADDGTPRLLELETTEPSLFFNFSAGAAERFVAALKRRMNG